jgi:MoxR-like ATPase
MNRTTKDKVNKEKNPERKKMFKSNKMESNKIIHLKEEISKVIVGQEEVIKKVIIAMLAGGNVLLEGAPGLAKTLLVNTLAQASDLKFKRIQFTPDLLPTDILGTKIYNQKNGEFITKKGPIFTNFLLADEINRAPPKTQSAMLEAMQERQVSILGETYNLPEPFIVLATQNPIEQEGTYPLPEAQVDRFMFKLLVDYPSKEDEIEILNRMTINKKIKINKIIDGKEIISLQKEIRNIYVDDLIKDYVTTIVDVTRNPEKYDFSLGKYIKWGASPRANIWTILASKVNAYLNNREYVTVEDVLDIIKDVLRHRIILTYEAQIDNIDVDEIIEGILKIVKMP